MSCMPKTYQFVFVLILGVFALHTSAQNSHLYTQYIFNQYAINPAVAGTFTCTEFKFGQRRQMIGFEGGPTTSFFTINGKLGRANNFRKAFHGVGAMFFADDAGAFSSRGFYLSYAYNFIIKRDYRLALGTFVGMRSYVFSSGGLVIFDMADPTLGKTKTVLMYPEFHPGAWLYGKKMFAGLAIFNLYKTKLTGGGDNIGSPAPIRPTFIGTYGKKIESSGYYFTYIPSVQVRFTPFAMPTVDFNFLWYIKHQFGLGISYRTYNTIAALAKFRFARRFDIGYSFDYAVGALRNLSPYTHEVVLSFRACSNEKDLEPKYTCPAYE